MKSLDFTYVVYYIVYGWQPIGAKLIENLYFSIEKIGINVLNENEADYRIDKAFSKKRTLVKF